MRIDPTSPAANWLRCAATAGNWRDRKQLRQDFTGEIAAALDELHDDAVDRLVDRLFNHKWFSFEPRPDNKAEGDEQTGFYESRDLITIALGGNGSGKTYIAAMKCIAFLCERQPPPTPGAQFWVIGPTLEQCGGAAWDQKLSTLLPEEWVQWDKISWHDGNRNLPKAVPLCPWPSNPRNNWTLVFKSYDQRREAMQAMAIGGAWFTEQYHEEIFDEVYRGTREYAFKGAVWSEFTPIDPEKSVEIEKIYERWIAGEHKARHYGFYHLNTIEAVKAGHVQSDWADSYFDKVSDEMAETRKYGAFASYEGAIYRSFNPKIHLYDGPELNEDYNFPIGAIHKRAVDWGSSEEHPFVCLWGYKDCIGTWYIYDEYWSNNPLTMWAEHAMAIKERWPWPPNNPHYRQTYGDPSRVDCLREFNAMGIPIAAARNDVDEGIERVRGHLKLAGPYKEPKLYIDRRRCPVLARQMKTYRWHRSSNTGLNPSAAKPVPLKRDDDCVDALRYLIFSDYTYNTHGVEGATIVKPAPTGVRFRRVARNR